MCCGEMRSSLGVVKLGILRLRLSRGLDAREPCEMCCGEMRSSLGVVKLGILRLRLSRGLDARGCQPLRRRSVMPWWRRGSYATTSPTDLPSTGAPHGCPRGRVDTRGLLPRVRALCASCDPRGPPAALPRGLSAVSHPHGSPVHHISSPHHHVQVSNPFSRF